MHSITHISIHSVVHSLIPTLVTKSFTPSLTHSLTLIISYHLFFDSLDFKLCRCCGANNSGSVQHHQQVLLGLVLWPEERRPVPVHCCAAAPAAHAVAVPGHAQCAVPLCLGRPRVCVCVSSLSYTVLSAASMLTDIGPTEEDEEPPDDQRTTFKPPVFCPSHSLDHSLSFVALCFLGLACI